MPYSQVSPNYSIHFPLTLRKSLPNPPCPVLASGLPFPRAGGCSGCQDPGLAVLDRAAPTAVGPSTYGPRRHQLPVWNTPIASLWCSASRQAIDQATCCLPDTHHHLAVPEAPITCPTRMVPGIWSWPFSIWPLPLARMFKFEYAVMGTTACTTENRGSAGGPSHLSRNLPAFTTHWFVFISRSFTCASHLFH